MNRLSDKIKTKVGLYLNIMQVCTWESLAGLPEDFWIKYLNKRYLGGVPLINDRYPKIIRTLLPGHSYVVRNPRSLVNFLGRQSPGELLQIGVFLNSTELVEAQLSFTEVEEVHQALQLARKRKRKNLLLRLAQEESRRRE